ncbi:MAG: hypothetical protein HQM12_06585 [SAR324 cluster bacterium]|nr:hypothetical protein [SAR324 cluster bacterium]
MTLFLFLIIPGGCADIVQPSNASVCEDAFNARDYDTAIEKCTDRKSLAGAYLGKAGFDIVSLLKSSESPVETLNDPTGGQLGSDVSAGASVMNILQIGTAQISSSTDRLTAMETIRTYLAKVSELLKDKTASDLSGDEIFLEIFASLFDTVLVYVETLDTGTTDDDGVPEPILVDANGKQYLTDYNGVPTPYVSDTAGKAYKTNDDGTPVTSVTLDGIVLTYADNTTATFTSAEAASNAVKFALEYTDGTTAVFDDEQTLKSSLVLDIHCVSVANADSALIKTDGHIWTAEQYGAFCSIFKKNIDGDSILADLLAGKGVTFDLTEVQAAVCIELTPMIESFRLFSAALNKLVEKAGSNTASDNDTISGSSAAIDDLLAELGCSL